MNLLSRFICILLFSAALCFPVLPADGDMGFPTPDSQNALAKTETKKIDPRLEAFINILIWLIRQ
jgi:hypothetical protein